MAESSQHTWSHVVSGAAIHLLGPNQMCSCEASHVCQEVNAKLLEALEGLKCWDCEYPFTQSDYAGCYTCKSAREAIEEAKK